MTNLYTKTVTFRKAELPFRVISLHMAARSTRSMDIYDLRRANFRRLLDQIGGNRKQMASMMGWEGESLVARYLSESPKTKKAIGSPLARRMERVFLKPVGWMDSLPFSKRAFDFAVSYDVVPEDKRATIDAVINMAIPEPEPPLVLPPPPAPVPAAPKRKRRP